MHSRGPQSIAVDYDIIVSEDFLPIVQLVCTFRSIFVYVNTSSSMSQLQICSVLLFKRKIFQVTTRSYVAFSVGFSGRREYFSTSLSQVKFERRLEVPRARGESTI
jgi:hypothetical protein